MSKTDTIKISKAERSRQRILQAEELVRVRRQQLRDAKAQAQFSKSDVSAEPSVIVLARLAQEEARSWLESAQRMLKAAQRAEVTDDPQLAQAVVHQLEKLGLPYPVRAVCEEPSDVPEERRPVLFVFQEKPSQDSPSGHRGSVELSYHKLPGLHSALDGEELAHRLDDTDAVIRKRPVYVPGREVDRVVLDDVSAPRVEPIAEPIRDHNAGALIENIAMRVARQFKAPFGPVPLTRHEGSGVQGQDFYGVVSDFAPKNDDLPRPSFTTEEHAGVRTATVVGWIGLSADEKGGRDIERKQLIDQAARFVAAEAGRTVSPFGRIVSAEVRGVKPLPGAAVYLELVVTAEASVQ